MKKKDQESLRKIVIIGLVLVVGYLGYQSMTSGSSPFSEASEPTVGGRYRDISTAKEAWEAGYSKDFINTMGLPGEIPTDDEIQENPVEEPIIVLYGEELNGDELAITRAANGFSEICDRVGGIVKPGESGCWCEKQKTYINPYANRCNGGLRPTPRPIPQLGLPAECGDGQRKESEECDDGNRNSGDGCDDRCRVEEGFACNGEPSVCEKQLEKCCLCQYMKVEECSFFNRSTIYDLDDPEKVCDDCTYDGSPTTMEEGCEMLLVGGTLDCNWEGGKCVSRFKTMCDDWSENPDQNDCDIKIVDTDEKNPGEYSKLSPNRCIDFNYVRHGHGRGCLAAGEAISGCFTITTGTITGFEESCSTFQDQEALMREVARIKRQLRPGQVVVWTAHQAVETPLCTSIQSFEITSDDFTTTYGSCSSLGHSNYSDNDCLKLYEKASCTDDDTGKIVQKMCCPKTKYYFPIFFVDYKGWDDIDPITGFCSGYKTIAKTVCVGRANLSESDYVEKGFDRMFECIEDRRKWSEGMSDTIFIRDVDKITTKKEGGQYIVQEWWSCYKEK